MDQQSELEDFCVELLGTLYDEPVAFSLRDGDGKTQSLEHRLPLQRYRLGCYAIENVLVTDESLAVLQTTWPAFSEKAERWLAENKGHKDAELIRELTASDERLRHAKIKPIRQLICALCESQKPWEVVAGQAIGGLAPESVNQESMLADFLGRNMLKEVMFRAR